MKHIGLSRANYLSATDNTWKQWLEHNKITEMLCTSLTPLNDTYTVWEAVCFISEGIGKLRIDYDGNYALKTEIIETTPGNAEWLEGQ